MNEENEKLVFECPTDEERDRAAKEFAEQMKWARSLSDKQINFLCDGGWYNNTIKGYLIAAARNAGLDEQQISDLLQGLRQAFSDYDKVEAEEIYLKS